MGYAIEVIDGIVTQVLATDDIPAGWIASETPAGIGWVYTESSFSEPTIDSGDALATERENMTVTPVQMRIALAAAGLLDAVNAVAAADPTAAVVWEYATEIVRTSALIDALAANVTDPETSLPITAERIDDLFRAAKSVEV